MKTFMQVFIRPEVIYIQLTIHWLSVKIYFPIFFLEEDDHSFMLTLQQAPDSVLPT